MPTAFVAVTLKPYVSPVVSPVTRMPSEDPAPVTVPVNAPANDVALYDVITEPLSAGASNQTVIVVGPVEVNLGFNGDEGTLADAVAVADADLLAVAEGVVEALALALALALAVDADAEAVSEGVADADADVDALADAVESPRTPRTTGAPASAALPPHPARSITAHAMAAPAALLFVERGLDAPKRLSRALIVGRASPGLSPLIVLVTDTLWVGGLRHYRVNTVLFKEFCPVCGGLSYFRSLERALRVDQRQAARHQLMTYGFASSSTIRTSPTVSSAGSPGP